MSVREDRWSVRESHVDPRSRARPGASLVVVVAVASLVAILLLAGSGAAIGPRSADPDLQVKDLALRDARAAARLDWQQVWRDYCPGFQTANPQRPWVASQRASLPVSAPADTQFSVVGVRADGPYRRVEVRVTAPGYPPQDGEIDYRLTRSGPWVKVDEGAVGHAIHDACGASA